MKSHKVGRVRKQGYSITRLVPYTTKNVGQWLLEWTPIQGRRHEAVGRQFPFLDVIFLMCYHPVLISCCVDNERASNLWLQVRLESSILSTQQTTIPTTRKVYHIPQRTQKLDTARGSEEDEAMNVVQYNFAGPSYRRKPSKILPQIMSGGVNRRLKYLP